MSILGVCVDAMNPFGGPKPADLGQLQWVRQVAFPGPTVAEYFFQLHMAGFDTALVLGLESLGEDQSQWASLARGYVRTCRPSVVVVGNEMDAYLLGVPSPSSWSLRPPRYRQLVGEVMKGLNQVHPRPLVIGGGSVSGQPSWWQNVDPAGLGLDGIDVHPYGKDPAEARQLLRLYKQYGLPLYVLEWNRPAAEIGAYAQMLEEEDVQAGCFFCWSEGMVPGFGLVDPNGNPTDEHTQIMAAAAAG